MSYSVRGVARHFLHVGGGFSLGPTLFPGSPAGPRSVRERLRQLSTREYSYEKEECKYEWTAAYQQRWSHIVVRIELSPFLIPIPDSTMNALRSTWESGIQSIWSNRWAIGRAGEAPCEIEVDAQWVIANWHHSVAVVTGSGETNMGIWHTTDTGRDAAHEVGHMLGHADEYDNPECPSRFPVNTGTIMERSTTVPARLMQGFADNVQSNVVPIP